jgi:hypothetical protein
MLRSFLSFPCIDEDLSDGWSGRERAHMSIAEAIVFIIAIEEEQIVRKK